MWYQHGMTGFGWTLMTVAMLVFWALVVGAVILVVRALGHRGEAGGTAQSGGPTVSGPSTAEHLLAERFARGEIDEDEYWRRLAVLRGASDRSPQG